MSFFVLFSKHCIIRPCVFSKLWAKSADKASTQLKMLQSLYQYWATEGLQGFQSRSTLKKPITQIFVLFTLTFRSIPLTFRSITLTFRSITLILFQSKYHTQEREKNDYRVYTLNSMYSPNWYFLDFFQFPNDVCGLLYEQGRISWNVWSYSLWWNAWKVSMH